YLDADTGYAVEGLGGVGGVCLVGLGAVREDEAHLHVRYTGSHHFTHGVAVQVHAFGAKQSVILVAPPREDVHLLDGGAGGVHQVVVGEVGRVVQDLAASHVGEVHRCTPGLLLDLVRDHQAPLRVGGEHRGRALPPVPLLAGGS